MIKNIIFDLGDVIINIDVPCVTRSFATLAQIDVEKADEIIKQSELFRKCETGLINEADFRDYVRELFEQPQWTDKAIDEAWNTVLLDIPPARIETIKRLSANYRLFLLSNTSPIHVRATNAILRETTGIEKLNDLMEHVFLSCEMKVMKPDHKIYEMVLAHAQIKAEETLFLDDNSDNIRAAATMGIQTIHVQKPTSIVEYLKGY